MSLITGFVVLCSGGKENKEIFHTHILYPCWMAPSEVVDKKLVK